MKFCKGGFDKARHFMNLIDAGLIETMHAVTTITGKIKAIEGDPTVQAIEAIIPNGSAYVAVFDAAVDRLSGAAQAGLSVAEKIVSLIAGKAEDTKDAMLLKLASTTTAITDGNRYDQHTYDTATQVHIEGLK